MRYYLDTNILVFILDNEYDNLHSDIRVILEDYANSLFISSIVLQELVLLFRLGKLNPKSQYKNEKDLIKKVEELGIEIVFFSKNNLSTYLNLSVSENHKDMNDHLIISQAISEKIDLISSDRKFEDYRNQGLKFIYNRR